MYQGVVRFEKGNRSGEIELLEATRMGVLGQTALSSTDPTRDQVH